MRVNKTKENLQELWQLLDDASGSLYNACGMITSMTGIQDIKDDMDKIDLSAIVELKNKVEALKNGKE